MQKKTPAEMFLEASLEAKTVDEIASVEDLREPNPRKLGGPDLPYEGLYSFKKSASRIVGDNSFRIDPEKKEMVGRYISFVPGIPVTSSNWISYQFGLADTLSREFKIEKPDEFGRFPGTGLTTTFLNLRVVSGLAQQHGGSTRPRNYEPGQQLNLKYSDTQGQLRKIVELGLPTKKTDEGMAGWCARKLNGWPTLVDEWVDEACAMLHHEHWSPTGHAMYGDSSPSFPVSTNNPWLQHFMLEMALDAMDYIATLNEAEVWLSWDKLASDFGVVRAFMRWFRRQGREVKYLSDAPEWAGNACVDVATKPRFVTPFEDLVDWMKTGNVKEEVPVGMSVEVLLNGVLYGAFVQRMREFYMGGKPFTEISRLICNPSMVGSFNAYPLMLHTNLGTELELLFNKCPFLRIWDIDAQDRETMPATNDQFANVLKRYIQPSIAEFIRAGNYGSVIVTNDRGAFKNRGDLEDRRIPRPSYVVVGNSQSAYPEFTFGLLSGYGTVKQQGNFNGTQNSALMHRAANTGPFRGFDAWVESRGRISRDDVITNALNRLKEAGHWRTPGYGRVSLGDNNCDGFAEDKEARRFGNALNANWKHRCSVSKKIAGQIPVYIGGRLFFRNDIESYVGNPFDLEESVLSKTSPYGCDGYFLKQGSYNLPDKSRVHRIVSETFRNYNPGKYSLDDAMRPYRRIRDTGQIPWETQLVMALGPKAMRFVKAGIIPLDKVPLLAASTTTIPASQIFPRILTHLSREAVIITDEDGKSILKEDLLRLGISEKEMEQARKGGLPTVVEGWSEGRGQK